MLTVYQGSGSSEFAVGKTVYPDEHWLKIKHSASQFLRSHKCSNSAEILDNTHFNLHHGENKRGDEFCVLYAELPIDDYSAIVERFEDDTDQCCIFAPIAKSVREVSGQDVRFISYQLTLDEGISYVSEPELRLTNRIVECALEDARRLIRTGSATNGVDRVHTALHGYFRAVCNDALINVDDDATVTQLYNEIRYRHPAFQAGSLRSDDTTKIMTSLSNVIDSLNPFINRGSLARPHDGLYAKPEADLVLNAVHTLLHYFDQKIG